MCPVTGKNIHVTGLLVRYDPLVRTREQDPDFGIIPDVDEKHALLERDILNTQTDGVSRESRSDTCFFISFIFSGLRVPITAWMIDFSSE